MTEHAFARQIRPARPRLRTILGATVLAAGLSCALKLDPVYRVCLISKGAMEEAQFIPGPGRNISQASR